MAVTITAAKNKKETTAKVAKALTGLMPVVRNKRGKKNGRLDIKKPARINIKVFIRKKTAY